MPSTIGDQDVLGIGQEPIIINLNGLRFNILPREYTIEEKVGEFPGIKLEGILRPMPENSMARFPFECLKQGISNAVKQCGEGYTESLFVDALQAIEELWPQTARPKKEVKSFQKLGRHLLMEVENVNPKS